MHTAAQYSHKRRVTRMTDFDRVDLRSLTHTKVAHVDMEGKDLRGVNFAGADFVHANFAGADLRGTIWNDARISHANFAGADLRGATWQNAYIVHGDFRKADLRGTYWKGTRISHKKVTGADLRGALYLNETHQQKAANKRPSTTTGREVPVVSWENTDKLRRLVDDDRHLQADSDKANRIVEATRAKSQHIANANRHKAQYYEEVSRGNRLANADNHLVLTTQYENQLKETITAHFAQITSAEEQLFAIAVQQRELTLKQQKELLENLLCVKTITADMFDFQTEYAVENLISGTSLKAVQKWVETHHIVDKDAYLQWLDATDRTNCLASTNEWTLDYGTDGKLTRYTRDSSPLSRWTWAHEEMLANEAYLIKGWYFYQEMIKEGYRLTQKQTTSVPEPTTHKQMTTAVKIAVFPPVIYIALEKLVQVL